jgi:hypothetical protein
MPIQIVDNFLYVYSPQEISSVYNKTSSWSDTAKHFDMSQRNLYRIRKRLGMV